MVPSLSSLPSHVHHFLSANPNPNFNLLHRRTQIVNFTTYSSPPRKVEHSITTPPPSSSNKKSFALAAGEIFLGLVSQLIKSQSKSPVSDSGYVAIFENSTENGELYKERIGAVMKDETKPKVLCEQRVKDLEAEWEMCVVTILESSFSAAGLLFPYHLGVAQFLIEKGYIKPYCHTLHGFFTSSTYRRRFCKCRSLAPMLSICPYTWSSSGYSIFKFSCSSIATLIKVCKTTEHLHQVHARIIRKGLEQDQFLIAEFICLSNSLTSLNYSSSIFDRVTRPKSFLWNSFIRGYCQKSCFMDILSIFIRMKREACLPDNYTFPSVIKACSTACKVWEGKLIHGSVLRSGFEGCVFVGTSLIDMYGKCGETRDARMVFDGMTERNVVSWTAMVVGYVTVGDVVEAKKLFNAMQERNMASWNAMILGFVTVGDLSSARGIFDSMPEKNVVSFTTMIDGYAKCGDMVSARFLFDQFLDKDIVAWSALISGYVQNGQPNAALKFFLEMESMNVKPDEFILVSLMSACSQLGCLELAQWVDSYVSKSSINLQQNHVITALVDMNAKSGNMERALKLFEEMPKRDLISYCSMIQGLSIHGHGVEAISLFNRMLTEGLTPDEVAFTIILTACSHAGLVDEGWHYFKAMKHKFCIIPSPDHYACMVYLLSRSGQLRAAYELIKSMPVEPHAGAWGALLGACKLYSDSDLGEIVAGRLFELEPKNAANYVLLSNIYAAAERWIDVSLVRNKMRERGVRKIPGCSQI